MTPINMDVQDEGFMRRCIELALEAANAGESAVGSLIVQSGKIVGEGREGTRKRSDPAAHAEIEAIRDALRPGQNTRVDFAQCTMYTTVEPCFMCAYAIREAGIARVVIGTSAGEIGALHSKYPLLADQTISRWNTAPRITENVLEAECRFILRHKKLPGS